MTSSQSIVHIAVEGMTDEFIIRRILNYVGFQCGYVRGLSGKPPLVNDLPKYNSAGRFTNWLVVIDLDQDGDCAPTYLRTLVSESSEGLLLRIPVRAIESWLLADRERLAKFLDISVDLVPDEPDKEANPKLTLVNLARRCRKTALLNDLVPRQGSGAKVGPGYASRIQEFVEQSKHRWRPEIAQNHSDSLKRCITALQKWKLVGLE